MASLSALRSSASVVVAIVVAVVLLAAIGVEAETRKYQFDVSLFVYY
jgi:laccase